MKLFVLILAIVTAVAAAPEPMPTPAPHMADLFAALQRRHTREISPSTVLTVQIVKSMEMGTRLFAGMDFLSLLM
jgi:hypothetical protein